MAPGADADATATTTDPLRLTAAALAQRNEHHGTVGWLAEHSL